MKAEALQANKEILRLAIPNLVSNLTVPLLGAIDLAMIGHADDLAAMGAISLGSMIFNFIYWALGFLRMGTCGFTAQAVGLKNEKETLCILFRALFIVFCGSLLLLVFQTPILHAALLWAKPEADLARATASYFQIRIWAAPAALSAFAFAGWFIGRQDAKSPMWVSIGINLANIAFNYGFVFVKGMGAEGVAWGTVCAQYTGLLLNMGFAARSLNQQFRNAGDRALQPRRFSCTALRQGLENVRASDIFQSRPLKKFLNVNTDIFLRTLLTIFVFSFFTAQSTRLGNQYLVLNTLLYQFFIFYSYAMDGFSHAAEALSGKYTGGSRWNEKRAVVKQVFRWGAGTAAVFCACYAAFYTPILRIFTQDSALLEMSREYYFWILAIALTGFPAFLWDGVYAGSLAARSMLVTMALAASGFLAAYCLLVPSLHNHAMWTAMTLFLLLRGGLMTGWAFRSGILPGKNTSGK